ncbi:hypothetical protein [Desulfobulbus elongatus]|uniref:hypothetical protein n=1 Tax=Desulfobulbus elongatus TaxID=53332 RepID=UPI0012F95D12|nr:hypothetical protein [Desulfobulbus elongatus]
MSWKVLSTNKIKGFGPIFPLFSPNFRLRRPNNDAPFSQNNPKMLAISLPLPGGGSRRPTVFSGKQKKD